MAISDEQVTSLRALLSADSDKGVELTERLVRTGDLEGYGSLIYAAFVVAVRRRFQPSWTIPGVVRLVASVRARLLKAEIEIDPLAAEVLTRRALGDGVVGELDDETKARVQIFMLAELVADEQLDESALDEFMKQVRALAHHFDRLSHQHCSLNSDLPRSAKERPAHALGAADHEGREAEQASDAVGGDMTGLDGRL